MSGTLLIKLGLPYGCFALSMFNYYIGVPMLQYAVCHSLHIRLTMLQYPVFHSHIHNDDLEIAGLSKCRLRP